MSDWDKPMEDGLNEMLDRRILIKAQAARIAELEAALNTIIDKTGRAHPMSYVADIWRIARAALTGGKDD